MRQCVNVDLANYAGSQRLCELLVNPAVYTLLIEFTRYCSHIPVHPIHLVYRWAIRIRLDRQEDDLTGVFIDNFIRLKLQ